MKNNLFAKDFISTKHITKDEVQLILHIAKKLKDNPETNILKNKVIANCFFEPSTRTSLSFETAAKRLGANVIGFSSAESLSVKKGESLADTMRMMDAYADLIVIRHPLEGSAALAADVATHPVINAGDGANQHPTQAMLDLFTIQECQEKLNGLSIALVGDLKYGRTIHSLTDLCCMFDIRLYLVSPESLTLPEEICDHLKRNSLRFSFHHSLDEVINKVDVLYMTRIQVERFGKLDATQFENPYVVNNELLKKAKSNLKILHPLPRLSEIHPEIDASEHAYYFQQAANAVWVRQALLTLILNKELS